MKKLNPAQTKYLEDFSLNLHFDEDGYRVFSLTDLQGADLGSIESESFVTLGQIIDRLDIYHYDHFDPSHPENEGHENVYWDFLQNDDASEFLCRFTADDYHEYLEDMKRKDISRDSATSR